MIQVFNFDVYVLLDPRVNLSFVNPYFRMNFEVLLKKPLESFSVSTSVGESILV